MNDIDKEFKVKSSLIMKSRRHNKVWLHLEEIDTWGKVIHYICNTYLFS